jgi:hypothetical protein
MIKKLPRTPMRPEKEPGAEIEIWQPEWKCFCCHDSGVIVPRLARLVINGYNENRDKLPRCVAPGCKSGSQYDSETLAPSVDYRIDATTCQQLGSIEQDVWRKTVQVKAQRIQSATKALASQKSLRTCDRSPMEEQGSLERHRLVVEEDWGLVAATEAQKKWSARWEGEG